MRTIEEIYQALMASFMQRAGFHMEESCDLAIRLYALAAQIQALEVQADWVLEQSFPQTAQGVYLERHAEMRGIQRIGAAKAKGVLRFAAEREAKQVLTIPAGTVCMTVGEVRFQTREDAYIAVGETTVDVEAEAMEAGKAGNVPAGTIVLLTACPAGVTACTNVEAFLGGSDEETDQALRVRVLDSYRRLPNGANAAYYELTAMQHEGVSAARAIGRARGIGTVDVYVAGEDGVPDEELLERVQGDLQQKREIAVDVQVLAPETEQVDVAVEIEAKDGAVFETVQAEVSRAILQMFRGDRLGKPLLLAELGDQIYRVEGVQNYRIMTPAADLPGRNTTLPVLGILQVTQMEA